MRITVESSSGDITSLLWNGNEAQDSAKRSHIVRSIEVEGTVAPELKFSCQASGIGASCSVAQSGSYIKVTCNASGITQ